MNTWTLFLSILLIFHQSLAKNEDAIPSTMCPRFSVHEFHLSVFKPLLQKRMDFIKDLLKSSTDGVEEMLVKVAEKQGNDGALIKHGLDAVREKGVKAIEEVKNELDQAWTKALDEYMMIHQWRDFFTQLQEKLSKFETELSKPFAAMVTLSKHLMDPVVEVLFKMIESKPEEEKAEQKAKMMETFKGRDKVLGHVMGKLVLAKLDDQVVDQELVLAPLITLLNKLSDDLYDKGRMMPIDAFWKGYLRETGWPLKFKESTEAEILQDMVDILASFFYHKPEFPEDE